MRTRSCAFICQTLPELCCAPFKALTCALLRRLTKIIFIVLSQIVDTIIRFDKPAVEDDGEEEEISPEMMNVLTRIDQQETK